MYAGDEWANPQFDKRAELFAVTKKKTEKVKWKCLNQAGIALASAVFISSTSIIDATGTLIRRKASKITSRFFPSSTKTTLPYSEQQ